MHRIGLVLSALALTLAVSAQVPQPSVVTIRLLARTFTPESGIDPGIERVRVEGKRRHVIVQFESAPSVEARKRMEKSGLRILDPIPERAFFASIANNSTAIASARKEFELRWVGAIETRDKILPELLRNGPPGYARRGKEAAEYIVEFFGDVTPTTARKILQSHEVKVLEELTPIHGFRVVMRDEAPQELAKTDEVKWIVPGPPPPTVDNDGVRDASGVNADAVTAAPYSLSGNGVIVGHWEPGRAVLGHGDTSGRISAPLSAIQTSERSVGYVDANANSAFDASEVFYIDMDGDRTVSAGDVRGVTIGAYAAGSIVAAGNTDIGSNLLVVDYPACYFDANSDFAFNVGESWYRDADFDVTVDAGETRLTANGGYAAGSIVAVGDTDVGRSLRYTGNVDLHPTHVVCTLAGSGARSAASGGAANQWKGVAPSATIRTYLAGSMNATYTDAAANNVVLSTNSWGMTHCHQTTPNGCYDVTSEFYDSVISGRQSSGAASGLARQLSIFASSGNAGNPERHDETIAANGQLDNGEAVYIDSDNSGTVTFNDRRRNAVGAYAANSYVAAADTDVGRVLANFNGNERHVTANGAYSNGQAMFRDADHSGTVTAGDTRINASSGYAAGSVVAGADTDTGTLIRMFSMWGTVRVPNSAKDTVEVGSVSSDTNVPATSSSRGPTSDGRIKPDISGPGTQFSGDWGVTSCAPGNGYAVLTGTSMATPAVAGTGTLLTEWYRSACASGGPRPDAVRALLVHSAEDRTAIPAVAGTFNGPDFQFGYGRARVKEAADLVPNHKQDSFAAVGSQDTTITIGRVQPLKVTLAWDDAPHTGNAAPSALIGLLQNDLDLLLIAPDGTQYTPWQLDPLNPGNPATQTVTPAAMVVPAAAIDHRNTIEQVYIADAMPGTWTIRVTASTLNLPPQGYTLVSEHLPPQAGLCTSAPSADAWMQDTAADSGAVPSTGTMWQSQDIWNRTPTADGVAAHQNPAYHVPSVPNYLYANVRNAPGSPLVKAARVDFWIASAAAGLSWPDDFTFVGSIPVANLSPGEVRQVGPLLWSPPNPAPSDHFCLYARLQSPQDPITLAENTDLDHNARNSNNIVWKNVHIVSVSSNAVTFLARNVTKERGGVDVIIRADPELIANGGTIRAALSGALEKSWRGRGKSEGFEITRTPSVPNRGEALDVLPPESEVAFRMTAPVAALRAIPMAPREAAPIRLMFTLDERAPRRDYKVEVIEMIGGREVGGIAYIVRH